MVSSTDLCNVIIVHKNVTKYLLTRRGRGGRLIQHTYRIDTWLGTDSSRNIATILGDTRPVVGKYCEIIPSVSVCLSIITNRIDFYAFLGNIRLDFRMKEFNNELSVEKPARLCTDNSRICTLKLIFCVISKIPYAYLKPSYEISITEKYCRKAKNCRISLKRHVHEVGKCSFTFLRPNFKFLLKIPSFFGKFQDSAAKFFKFQVSLANFIFL